jgi:hypothetical protein
LASGDGILVAIRVTSPQAKLLEFIADRGGEISWNWENCRPDVVAMAAELVEKRLVSDLRADRRIRLTDQGRSAVSQIREATRRAASIQS